MLSIIARKYCGPELLALIAGEEFAEQATKLVPLAAIGKSDIMTINEARKACRPYLKMLPVRELEGLTQQLKEAVDSSIVPNGDGYTVCYQTSQQKCRVTHFLDVDKSFHILCHLTFNVPIDGIKLLTPRSFSCCVYQRCRYLSISQVAHGILTDRITLTVLKGPYETKPERNWLLIPGTQLCLYDSQTVMDIRDNEQQPGDRILHKLEGLPHLVGVAGPVESNDSYTFLYRDDDIYHFMTVKKDWSESELSIGFLLPEPIYGMCKGGDGLILIGQRLYTVSM